jgi:hypothetical protein
MPPLLAAMRERGGSFANHYGEKSPPDARNATKSRGRLVASPGFPHGNYRYGFGASPAEGCAPGAG